MSSDTSSGRTRWPVRTLKLAARIVLVLLLLALAGKFWLAPAVIRRQACSALGRHWRGRVFVDDVEFNYFGPIRLRGLRAVGPARREWASIGEVTLLLKDWPSLHPYLTAVDAERVRLTAHFENGRCQPPILRPQTPEDGGLGEAGEYLDLQSVRVEDVTVALIDHGTGSQCGWRFSFSANRETGGRYEVRLVQEAPVASLVPVLSGSVDLETLESRLRVKLNYELRKDDADFLLGLFDAAHVRRAHGFVDLDVSLAGRLDRPAGLEATGTIELTDARAEAAKGPIIDDLDLRVRLNAGKAMLTSARALTPAGSVHVDTTPIEYDLTTGAVSADVHTLVVESAGGDYGGFWRDTFGGATARGRVMATGQIGFDPNRPRPVYFDFEVKPELAEVRFPNSPQQDLRYVTAGRLRLRSTEFETRDLAATFAKGRAKLSAVIRLGPAAAGDRGPALRDWADVSRLSGSGLLFMDDVDLVGVPVLPGLLQVMQVLPKGHKGLSDLHVLFALENGVVTVEEGKLANPISALDVEKGGKIDLRKKHLDLHVVVVGIRQLHTVLEAIPLLNLAVDFKDKLARFRVLGPWDDPPAKLVRKEPLADLSKGTEDFFKGVVKTGGQIGPGIVSGLKGIGDLFKKLDETLKKKPEK